MPQINLYCMNFLSVEKLDKHIAELTLFSELNFGIEKGDKIALVAKNGAGKSTLLRVLAKIEEPDGGMVTYRSGIRMALLPQDPDFYEDQSVAELIKSHQSGLLEVTNEYAKALDIQSHKPIKWICTRPGTTNADSTSCCSGLIFPIKVNKWQRFQEDKKKGSHWP